MKSSGVVRLSRQYSIYDEAEHFLGGANITKTIGDGFDVGGDTLTTSSSAGCSLFCSHNFEDNRSKRETAIDERWLVSYLKKDGSRIEQKMVANNGRTSKGLRQVLQERGLWDASLSLKEARALLSKQTDLLEQKEWLAKTVLEAGCSSDYYIKYHCELNYIEMLWGAAKAWSR